MSDIPRELALSEVTVTLPYQDWALGVSPALEAMGCHGCEPGDHLTPPSQDYTCPAHGMAAWRIDRALRRAREAHSGGDRG